jgi:hypothetical protein
MRGIVIAKMLMLAVWGLYLAIGLGQQTDGGRKFGRGHRTYGQYTAPLHDDEPDLIRSDRRRDRLAPSPRLPAHLRLQACRK